MQLPNCFPIVIVDACSLSTGIASIKNEIRYAVFPFNGFIYYDCDSGSSTL